MGKLVVLKFGDGSFTEGFPITFEIAEETLDSSGSSLSYRRLAEITGKLPPDPAIPSYYRRWQAIYRGLGTQLRLDAPSSQVTNISLTEDCQRAALALGYRLNIWLRAESFRPIREKWLEQLVPSDTLRVILQTEDPLIQRLPWYTWDLVERYTKAEVALSTPVYERVEQIAIAKDRIKILAILGNSRGIDIQADRALLEQLPNADVQFLVEPRRQTLTDHLWAQPWDILFFAGHSSSEEGCEEDKAEAENLEDREIYAEEMGHQGSGQIFINETESLTIPQLRYALKKAVERGLKLAILNSCDGLGLARNLADLRIPQIIVMREPVPDRVAQEFLKHFLAAFSRGESFYLSVREAREKLQGLEDRFPCATWLPAICQNPAEVPPTWHRLVGQPQQNSPLLDASPSPVTLPSPVQATRGFRFKQYSRQLLSRVLLPSLLLTAAMAGVRASGGLRPLELAAYDRMMQLRPTEALDKRLLIVTINDEERETYGQEVEGIGRISISDRHLNQLLETLETHQARVIGLDLYRDFAPEPGQEALAQQLQQNPRIITVCKARYVGGDSIAPPPNVPLNRVGFSDMPADADGALRRHLLFMTPVYQDRESPCTASTAFGTQVALNYLQRDGITPVFTDDRTLQLGDQRFPRLMPPAGGYQWGDTPGYQLLLNYRANQTLAHQVSLTAILSDEINPDIIRDRVVLVGVTAESSKDYWHTPLNPHMPGVLLQGHVVSQILSTTLDGRPLLWVWPRWGELLWIGGWSFIGGILAWKISGGLTQGITLLLTTGTLMASCFITLLWGGWVPLIPPILVVITPSMVRVIYTRLKPAPKSSTISMAEP